MLKKGSRVVINGITIIIDSVDHSKKLIHGYDAYGGLPITFHFSELEANKEDE